MPLSSRAGGASRWRSFRGVGRPVGGVAIGVGVAIALCAAVGMVWDWLAPDPDLPQGGGFSCLAAAAASVVFGILIYRWGRTADAESLSRREALLAVALIWFGAGACGALPFIFGADLSPADAFFESVSGMTTTGATVITDIEDRLSRPLLLWRSMSQWLGGMGIVVLFVAVFPSLGAGAKHMYKGEAPGAQAEGFKPRIAETSITLWKLYALFTVLEIVLLSLLGMDVFEAICHGLTTMSTGGFSTRDASVGGFGEPAFEWVIAIFMLIGSVNYGLYYLALRGRKLRVIVRDVEFRTFVGIVLLSIALLTLLNLDVHPDPLDSLRYATFMVGTTVSSTGYGTDDYTAFGTPAFAIMIFLMFVGGCSGSTAGGLKIERVVIMAKQSIAQIKRSFLPSVVQVVRMGKRVVPKPVLADVMSFFVVYMFCMAVGILVVAAIDDVPVPTAFGAMLTCLSNMGPGPFHDLAGFNDNFAAYSAVSKVFFVVAMLLGRLEFFTLFALLLPGFWRR
ncbi:MAG TPA: potassium transporter TrkG [Polyangiaceae bacterium LLY-WYZ-15_(1-7)]|nr:potassium transporter [Myxococcales bacterium]MAT24088.1 potassium transporter [Sandaracinus sp.]HJK91282.1 potassium transporter TrkG [Polyangiaceae bacterium LLY-WYZ-15_(1-7)]MBJ71895.1 potassium transporter [Sandaracinus sp.]HJL05983.1 potassium transporter TrkG [Polyangiaceae bacterium LLY-WYZ-15_(1-7)]